MTGKEIYTILAMRAAAWHGEVTDQMTEMWHQALADEPSDCAEEAMRSLTKSERFPPTIADFIERRRSLVRARDYRADQQRALPSPEPAPARWLTMLHRALSGIGTSDSGHRHTGPLGQDWSECPVCLKSRRANTPSGQRELARLQARKAGDEPPPREHTRPEHPNPDGTYVNGGELWYNPPAKAVPNQPPDEDF